MNDAPALRFSGATTPARAERHIVRVRFAQALARQSALEGADDEAVHAFRLACKRLRYAIERLENAPPPVRSAAKILARLTEELGFAHDCAQLADLASECKAPLVAQRARRDGHRHVTRAIRLWRHAFGSNGEFAALAAYTGFTWSVS